MSQEGDQSRVASIHHVMIAIPAGQEESARDFYGHVLGLAEIAKPESLQGRGGLWFRVGDLKLHLGIERDSRAARKAHVAFEIVWLYDLRHRLLQRGHSIDDDELLPGIDRIYLDDPFGNRLEFLEPLAEPSDV